MTMDRGRMLQTLLLVTTTIVISGAVDKVPFSFDDIFNSALRPRYYSGSWVASGDNMVYRDASNNVREGDVTGNSGGVTEGNILIPSTIMNDYYTYSLTRDRTYALLKYEVEGVWRHSNTARFKLYNIASPSTPTNFPNGAHSGQRLRYAGWSTNGQALTFVIGNNLYYQASPTANPEQITDDGNEELIFNGVSSWLYEEDVLATDKAHYWSPDGAHILFGRFDITGVPLMKFPRYGPAEQMYPDIYSVAYPKAGNLATDGTNAGPNDQVKLYLVATTNTSITTEITVPSDLAADDHYFVAANWLSETVVLVTWTNRVQTRHISMRCEMSGVCTKTLDYAQTGGWVQVEPPRVVVINSGAEYVTILPDSAPLGTSADQWPQVAIVKSGPSDTNQVTYKTSGRTDLVLSIRAYDPTTKLLYYYSNNGDATERHVKNINIETQAITCMTCGKTELAGTCLYTSASFSSTTNYYTLVCSGPDIPSHHLYNKDTTRNAVLVDNADVRTQMDKREIPEQELTTVPVTGYSDAATEIFRPVDDGQGHKYRHLSYVYGGPGSQRVTKRWPMGGSTSNWLTYLKSTHKIMVTSTDGRGTGGRGDKFLYEIYRGMGTVEIEDTNTATSHLRSNDDSIDATKPSAVFGWSYGGFTTGMALSASNSAFGCGASVAPVTDFKYYDTAYTERYMGLATPADNKAGYDATSILARADNFKGKKFMVAHGTADDNVHFMQSVHLIDSLMEAEVSFRQYLFKDQSHGIGGSHQSRALYQALTDFLINDCWPEEHVSGAASPQVALSVLLVSLVLALRNW